MTQIKSVQSDNRKDDKVSVSMLPLTAKTWTTAVITRTPTSCLPRSSRNKSQTLLIDKALDILDSPIKSHSERSSLDKRISSRGAVLQNKGSLLSQRQLRELLLDNGDLLSNMMHNCDDDFDSDYDSDMEE